MVQFVSGLDILCSQFLVSVWVAAATVVSATVIVLRRRRGTPRVLFHSVSVILAVAFASAASVNAHYAFLPTAGDVGDAITSNRQWVALSSVTHLSPTRLARARRHGLIARETIPPDREDGFGTTDGVVYLPPQYFTNPTEQFPVVYLFHGSPGQPADWFHAAPARWACPAWNQSAGWPGDPWNRYTTGNCSVGWVKYCGGK